MTSRRLAILSKSQARVDCFDCRGRPGSIGLRGLMIDRAVLVLCVVLTGQAASVRAQQQATPARPVVSLDAAAIRREAARLGEVRGLLADPDPNVRLLAMRKIMDSGDPVERQLAMQAGLASADSAMVELALRSMMRSIRQVVIALTDLDGKPLVKSDYHAEIVISIEKYDEPTGQFSGSDISGQLQGSVLSFRGSFVSGALLWDPEAQEFKGPVNQDSNSMAARRLGIWRPR